MGAILSERQSAILGGQMQPKFLVSVSGTREPNVVPLLSLMPMGPGQAAFAEFMIWKTKANLLETGQAAILALDAKLNYFAARGRFAGFTSSGPVFDAMADQAMFRYNPYNGIRGAGTIDLQTVDAEGRIPTLGLLAGHLRAGRLAGRLAKSAGSGPPPTVPVQVAEKFARLKALKAIAWPVAGGVKVLPIAGVAPVGRTGLLIADRAVAAAVPDGSRVAVAVITLDPIAYQVKGTARSRSGALLIEIDEAYTAAPPVPGRRCPAPV